MLQIKPIHWYTVEVIWKP